MRSLSMLMRLAEDMSRMSLLRSPFYEDSWSMYRLAASNQFNRYRKSDTLPKVGKDGFQVSMDVAQFKPSELNVKVVDNNVVVEGKYEDREDDDSGYVSGHFVRSYALPKGFDANKAISTLSSDGVLTVSVPKPPELADGSEERTIPIQQTGPAHLNIKDSHSKDENAVESGQASEKLDK